MQDWSNLPVLAAQGPHPYFGERIHSLPAPASTKRSSCIDAGAIVSRFERQVEIVGAMAEAASSGKQVADASIWV